MSNIDDIVKEIINQTRKYYMQNFIDYRQNNDIPYNPYLENLFKVAKAVLIKRLGTDYFDKNTAENILLQSLDEAFDYVEKNPNYTTDYIMLKIKKALNDRAFLGLL